MEGLLVTGAVLYLAKQKYDEQKTTLEKTLEKQKVANDRGTLFFNKPKFYAENIKLGNVKWDNNAKPPNTTPYVLKANPRGIEWVDWSAKGNEWLSSPEFRKKYVDNYRNAMSTETDHAIRTQLVGGFWHETITKGRTLQQTSRSDGVYNPDGPNLYLYYSK